MFGSSDAISKNILPILFLWMLIFFSLLCHHLCLGFCLGWDWHILASKQIFTEWMHALFSFSLIKHKFMKKLKLIPLRLWLRKSDLIKSIDIWHKIWSQCSFREWTYTQCMIHFELFNRPITLGFLQFTFCWNKPSTSVYFMLQ